MGEQPSPSSVWASSSGVIPVEGTFWLGTCDGVVSIGEGDDTSENEGRVLLFRANMILGLDLVLNLDVVAFSVCGLAGFSALGIVEFHEIEVAAPFVCVDLGAWCGIDVDIRCFNDVPPDEISRGAVEASVCMLISIDGNPLSFKLEASCAANVDVVPEFPFSFASYSNKRASISARRAKYALTW